MGFWKNAALLCALAAPASAADAPRSLSIVYGDATLKSAADRAFTKNRAVRFARMMDSAGAAAEVFADAALAEALAPPCRVAHFVNVQAMPRADFALVEKFVAGGGKIIAHGSMDPALAALFGLEAPRQAALQSGGFTFAGRPPMNCPARVANPVALNYGARPKAGSRARIIARWDGADAAAVISAPAGVWLTRTLSEEGGGRMDKAKLLVALSGLCHAEVWALAARRLRAEIPRALGAETLAEASRNLRRKTPRSKRAALDDQLSALEMFDRAVAAKFAAKTLAAAMPELWKMREYAFRALAAASVLKAGGKVVAVWISSPGALCGDGGWAPVLKRLRAAGVNAVFASEAAFGWRPPGGAQALAPALRAAGMKSHIWFPALKSDPARRKTLAAEKRLLTDAKGAPMDWLDPADARNAADAARRIADLAALYKPDGIHLDYVRYPADYGSVPRARKCAAMTDFMRAMRSAVKAQLALTAAVYQNGEPNGVGQSWFEWLREGLMDYAVPMNYTPSAEALAKICAVQTRAAPAGKIICGVGVTSFETNLDPAQTVAQALAALGGGCGGVAFYHCDQAFISEAAAALALAAP